MEAVRLKVNITLWMVAVRDRLATTTDTAQRALLCAMYAELARRLPA